MIFCPNCANMLVVSKDTGSNAFSCPTCPYQYPIKQPYVTHQQRLARKEVDDVLGGADSWKNVDSTDAQCTKCDNNRAYYMQIQIRSADEPMTTFYRCTKCGYQWKEN